VAHADLSVAPSNDNAESRPNSVSQLQSCDLQSIWK
jgi:hypothetical protein